MDRIRSQHDWTLGALVIWVGFLALAAHGGRLGFPSLYMDDVVRLAHLQADPARSMLRPFNEHLAPLFECVTWLAWQAAGRRLELAGTTFTWIGFVPFIWSLASLRRLVGRETGDPTAGAIAMIAFGLSRLEDETVFWFSATGFMWALAALLESVDAALAAARSETPRRRVGRAALSIGFALASPAFCGLGILAGPLASIAYFTADRDFQGAPRQRRLVFLSPMLGTLLYLGSAMLVRHGDVLARSAERNLNWRGGLQCLLQEPSLVLLPSIAGLPSLAGRISVGIAAAISLLSAFAILLWAIRFPRDRAILLVGGGLIVGGGVLTYPFRAADDLVWVLGVQRYHLFPLAGIAMILAAGWRRMSEYCPRFRGVERRVAAVAAIALLMFVIQRPGIKQHARFFDYREQDRTFAAIDRLAERARAAGMSRPDILSKLDPIRPVWAPDPDIFNSLELMQAWEVDGPNHRLTSREEILALLSPDEVEALCVGLDVGGRIRPASSTKLDRSSELVPIETSGSRIRALRVEGRYQTTGELAFLESIWERNSGAPRTLAARLPKRGELWWPDEEGRWSPLRSVSWDRTELNETSLIDLDGIPHWRWTGRMRLVIRGKEQTEIEQPRIFR